MNWTKKRKIAVLRRAKELLERKGGWIQNGWSSLGVNGPQYCLVGAVNQAARQLYLDKLQDEEKSISTELNVDAISLTTFVKEKTGIDNIPVFNDRSRTRKKDVLGVLDEYIGVLETA